MFALSNGNNFSVGDRVKILKDKSKVKSLQQGHGDWVDVMQKVLGEEGKVKNVLSSGDLRVKVLGATFTFNPKAVVKCDDSSSDDETNIGGMLLAMALLNSSLQDGSLGGGEQINFFKAAAVGDIAKVKELLRKGVNVNQKVQNTTALHVSSHKGQIEVVRLLLANGANQSIEDDDGETAIHCAVHGDKGEIVRLLASKGGPINTKNNKELSALHLAVIGERKSVVQILLGAGANVSTQDASGDTPIHDAIRKKNTDILRILLDKGASVMVINKKGFNSLHHAALLDNNEAVRIILEKNRQIVDAAKEDGFTALHLAVNNEHVQIIETLLTVGKANPNVKNSKGITPLHLGSAQTYVDAVKVLVTLSPQINLSPADEDGDTPLHEALRRADAVTDTEDASRRLLAALNPIFSLINSARGDPSKARDIATFLVKSGAQIQVRNHKNETPFDLCSDDTFKVQLSLLVSGAQSSSSSTTNKTSSSGSTSQVCSNCKRNSKDTVFQCGHMFCATCANKMSKCGQCNEKIKQKIKVFT